MHGIELHIMRVDILGGTHLHYTMYMMFTGLTLASTTMLTIILLCSPYSA